MFFFQTVVVRSGSEAGHVDGVGLVDCGYGCSATVLIRMCPADQQKELVNSSSGM